MFVAKYGKTYDSSDGSEQSFDGPGPMVRAGAQRGGQIGRERWEDDGGPANDSPALPIASKPAWSVLSLHDLNESIRRESRADDPARLAVDAARAERRAAAARQAAADGAAAAARAMADPYRTAWENT